MNPHAGTKHSDIVRRTGVGQALPADRKRTLTGYGAETFRGDDFTVRYELIAAGNAHPLGINTKRDRVVHVLEGQLFVQLAIPTEDSVEHKYVSVLAGGQYVAKAGTIHALGDSGTGDVSVMVVEPAASLKR